MRADWRSTGSSQRRPSQARSSKIAASYSGRAARGVDVFHAQREALAGLGRRDGGKGVAQMQIPVGLARSA